MPPHPEPASGSLAQAMSNARTAHSVREFHCQPATEIIGVRGLSATRLRTQKTFSMTMMTKTPLASNPPAGYKTNSRWLYLFVICSTINDKAATS